MAFGILLKTVNAWGGSAQQPSTSTEPSGVGQPLPGFEQFMFESIVRVSFEVPMKQSFNLSDGQTVLVSYWIDGFAVISALYFFDIVFGVPRSFSRKLCDSLKYNILTYCLHLSFATLLGLWRDFRNSKSDICKAGYQVHRVYAWGVSAVHSMSTQYGRRLSPSITTAGNESI
ncbi:hypothetical protein BC938DRAFT_475666 [Jimgerdemannia flammicorona]|uniref:Exportin-T C-terminal domain-containing protein n=1 Tax=Jimgerdemannia flammicorona TaxID=994334 RepID=A0A433PQF0_9FUNG|nr:hypothetical protein BC938DRAFT_475666 [Jimgerdemannia flammicorona]